jgi:hypothetical protein
VRQLECMIYRLGHLDVRLSGQEFIQCTEMRVDNDFSEFQRPEHYIRYIGALKSIPELSYLVILFLEPLEHELAVQVEYDMDEQGHKCSGVCLDFGLTMCDRS